MKGRLLLFVLLVAVDAIQVAMRLQKVHFEFELVIERQPVAAVAMVEAEPDDYYFQ